MLDDRIKRLKFSKEYLATHIANKKKRIKKVVAGDKLDRGATKRDKILKSLADDEYSSEGDDTSLHQEDLPKLHTNKRTNDAHPDDGDAIFDRRYNQKRGRWEWETHNGVETLWEPKESYIDEQGDEMALFQDFEANHPYQGNEEPEDNLSQGSMFIFNHTKKLASAQVRFRGSIHLSFR